MTPVGDRADVSPFIMLHYTAPVCKVQGFSTKKQVREIPDPHSAVFYASEVSAGVVSVLDTSAHSTRRSAKLCT